LRREIEGLMAVDHPHIVKLYEAFEDEDSFHLVMELCQGEELFERLMKNGKNADESSTMHIVY
jgi:calcium-dependent protein kinase